jgi:hypothetical protein
LCAPFLTPDQKINLFLQFACGVTSRGDDDEKSLDFFLVQPNYTTAVKITSAAAAAQLGVQQQKGVLLFV